ncbi:unnamed protein product [Clavelina lepadiformis]|uniref:Uncharacterized protein n=1 Tax=Clavelina lepadiformis TaxID=159417 RepID=A0ABP0GX66_CLALP
MVIHVHRIYQWISYRWFILRVKKRYALQSISQLRKGLSRPFLVPEYYRVTVIHYGEDVHKPALFCEDVSNTTTADEFFVQPNFHPNKTGDDVAAATKALRDAGVLVRKMANCLIVLVLGKDLNVKLKRAMRIVSGNVTEDL